MNSTEIILLLPVEMSYDELHLCSILTLSHSLLDSLKISSDSTRRKSFQRRTLLLDGNCIFNLTKSLMVHKEET